MKNEDYAAMNGMSNRFWGWGREDEELRETIKQFGLKISRPNNETINTGRTKTFRHIHEVKRERDKIHCLEQHKQSLERNPTDGLSSLEYHIFSVKEFSIDGDKFTILNVNLTCNNTESPWCDCEAINYTLATGI